MSKKILFKIRYPLLTVYALVLIGILASMYIPDKSKNESASSDDLENAEDAVPTVSIKPLRFSQATTGFPKFALSAEKADFFQEKGSGRLNNFKLVYIYDKGKKVTVTGVEALVKVKIDEDLTMGLGEADIICNKPVKAVFTSGMNFISEDLQWSGSKGDVSAHGNVELFGNDFKIEGKGMRANLKEEKIELLSKVKLMVIPEVINKAGKDGFI